MYAQKRKIVSVLLLVALTTSIYASWNAIQSQTFVNAHKKKIIMSNDAFGKALDFSKTGVQQLIDGVKMIPSSRDAGVTGSPSVRKSRVTVAILIPTTTNRIKNPSLQKLTLTTDCLPSIVATAESIYNYKVYVGTEHHDYLVTHFEEIKSMSVGNVEILPMVVKGGTENKVINEIANLAYKEGAEYMCRINDDTEFITQNWTSLGIEMLANFKPPNVGVVGPTFKQGNTQIMTHDMVHRTHLDIFNYYYPPVFENWFIDGWITLVYKPNRSVKLKTWEVIHSLKQGSRYSGDPSLRKFKSILVTIGNVAIEAYSKQKSACQKSRIISYCLFGSDPSNIEGAVANTKIASKLFPEWIVRIYHDKTVPNKTLETIKSDNVQLININTDKPFEPKEMWNLFVASDPCLERYLIRSIDTRLTARERAAVDQWIDSGKHFHIMRDHPFHVNHSVPSGMWGGTKYAVPDMMSLIQKYMKNGTHYGTVQQFLNKEIWQIAKMSVLQHDSVSCEKYPGSVSFPTERQEWGFVGSIYKNGQVRQNDLNVLKNTSQSEICKLKKFK